MRFWLASLFVGSLLLVGGAVSSAAESDGSTFIQRCRVLRDRHHSMLWVKLDPSVEADSAKIDVLFVDLDGNVLTEWIDVLIHATGSKREAVAVAEPSDVESDPWQVVPTPNQSLILAAAGAEVYLGGTLQGVCPAVTTPLSYDGALGATGACPDCVVALEACQCTEGFPGNHWMCSSLPLTNDCPTW